MGYIDFSFKFSISCGHNYLKVFSVIGVPKEQVTVNGELILGYPFDSRENGLEEENETFNVY